MTSPDIVTSQLAPKERYLKMYREIHNQFLKFDFANLQDFNQAFVEMNARIAELEAKITAELTKIQTDLKVHQHAWAGGNGGGPVGGTTLSSTSSYASSFSPTKPVTPKTTFVEQRDGILQATGPAIAPVGGI